MATEPDEVGIRRIRSGEGEPREPTCEPTEVIQRAEIRQDELGPRRAHQAGSRLEPRIERSGDSGEGADRELAVAGFPRNGEFERASVVAPRDGGRREGLRTELPGGQAEGPLRKEAVADGRRADGVPEVARFCDEDCVYVAHGVPPKVSRRRRARPS